MKRPHNRTLWDISWHNCVGGNLQGMAAPAPGLSAIPGEGQPGVSKLHLPSDQFADAGATFAWNAKKQVGAPAILQRHLHSLLSSFQAKKGER